MIPAECLAHGELLRGWLRQKEPVHPVCYSGSRKLNRGGPWGSVFLLLADSDPLDSSQKDPEVTMAQRVQDYLLAPFPGLLPRKATLTDSGDQEWTYLGPSFPLYQQEKWIRARNGVQDKEH